MRLGGRQRRGRQEGGRGPRRRRRHGLALRSGLLGKEKIAGTSILQFSGGKGWRC